LTALLIRFVQTKLNTQQF